MIPDFYFKKLDLFKSQWRGYLLLKQFRSEYAENEVLSNRHAVRTLQLDLFLVP